MKFRLHKGSIAESMETEVDIEPTKEALATLLDTTPDKVEVDKYIYDNRIGWDTYLVTIDGFAVGMTDGDVER